MSQTPLPLIDPRYRMVFLTLFGVFTVFGTSMTVIGATLPKILDTFGWSYLVAGLVLAANAIAYFSFTFVGGHLIKVAGPKRTITLGLAISALGLMFFAATPDPLTNILLSALIGVGQGFVEIAVNWTTLRLDTAKTGRPMNLMHGAFAVGAILGPLALGGLLKAGFDWIAVYRGMTAIFATLTVLILLTPLHLGPEPVSTAPGQAPQPLGTHPAYWLSFLALFFYVGVELGVSNWVAVYFVAVFDYPASQSALLVSLFWAGLLAGRFGVPILYHGARQDLMLLGFSLLATIAIAALGLLGFAPPGVLTKAVGLTLVLLSGLGCSIFYPAVITLLGNCFPHAQSQAIGFAATGGGIGAFVFPFLMSALAQGWGIRAGFATYAVFGIAMTLAALGLSRSSTRHAAR
jgi:fucose permease